MIPELRQCRQEAGVQGYPWLHCNLETSLGSVGLGYLWLHCNLETSLGSVGLDVKTVTKPDKQKQQQLSNI